MSTVQPIQDQHLRSNTVIIRKGLLGGVQVMLYDGHQYRMATNNLDLLGQARALVKDLDKGDYFCPIELSVLALF